MALVETRLSGCYHSLILNKFLKLEYQSVKNTGVLLKLLASSQNKVK